MNGTTRRRAMWAGAVGTVVAALVSSGAVTANAAPAGAGLAASADPDVSVTLPYQRAEVTSLGINPGQSELVVPVTNRGTAPAHNVVVDVTTVPGRYALHKVISVLAPGATNVLGVASNTGQFYPGFVTVRAQESERDANLTNNVAGGIRLYVGDFTGIA